MFRTVLVHHQEQLYKLYIAFGICRYYARRMVPAYTGVYQMRCTAYKVAPDDGLIQSETCRASNEKIKFNHRNLCILLVYIYIEILKLFDVQTLLHIVLKNTGEFHLL